MTIPKRLRRRSGNELAEEIEAHLRMATRDRIERGESPEEAALAARREFGNVDLVTAVTRDTWGWAWLEQAVRDVRLSMRSMAREPGYAAVLVLTLALGIGANTAIFTLVNAALLEPLPFRDSGRLVALWEHNGQRPGRPNVVGPANLIRWRERATAFERISAMYDYRSALSGSGDPEELGAQAVTPEFFRTLGVSPILGRIFVDGEGAGHFSDQNPVVVISYELWQRRFGGDRGIIGRTIRLGGSPSAVVGVMPPGVRFILRAGSLTGKPPDVWLPFQFLDSMRRPRGRFLSVIARLGPGISLDQAQAQIDTIADGLSREWPAFDTGWTVRLSPIRSELSGEFRPALLVLAAAVGFLLLIACANVANLLLARGAARRREFAIRTALGAGRGQVVRQLLTETFVLCLMGGGAGLLVATWSVRFLLAVSPVELGEFGHVGLSLPVLAFTVLASIATAALCGLAPALDASRSHARDALRDDTRRGGSSPFSRRLRHAFVVSEVALAVVLLVGAGLLIRSFANLRAVDAGFDASHVLTLRIALPQAGYETDEQRLHFFREAVARASTLPGVKAAGVVSFLPFAGLGAATSFTVEGRPAPAPGQEATADVRVCDDGYFKALRIPLTRGRWFEPRELRERADVVIVNAALARQYFRGEDPLGKRLFVNMSEPIVATTIIGVVGDVRHADLTTEVRPMVYWPHPQLPYSAMTLTVRTAADPLSVVPLLEREVRSIDPNQPVSDIRTMDQWVARSLARARFTWTILAIFAGIALLLTSIGIFGVVSYAVNQRRAEIGVRLALGADEGTIVRMVVWQGLALTAGGLGAGTVLALLLARTLTSLLFGIGRFDPAAFASAICLLGGVAVVASYLPARRASRMNPVETLRQD